MASAAIHGLLFVAWFDLAGNANSAAMQQETVLEVVSIELIPETPKVNTTLSSIIPTAIAASKPEQISLKKPAELQAVRSPEQEQPAARLAEAGPQVTTSQSLQTVLPQQASIPNPHEETNSLVRNHLESFKFYPASARKRGIEGHVDVAFILTHNGAADRITVLQGSGYAMLDRAAMQTVSRAQPFPVDDGSYRFRLRFKRL
ncbi:MAG: hypothetical protein CO187_10555 [Zetaproteobacteria bacterium CG_4_9_14_3_um_filter_53_7]|nr:MAG: hypothetical protein CO187_10555 [Zetaproteobacteria bacterium CG_4_9_14_3_um_filter_53_7]